MKSNRLWWAVFLACTALVLTALAWMTLAMLRSERAEFHAQDMATHQESLRLALWRMDSWLAPRVAREAARPYTDYQTLAPQQVAYNNKMEPLEAGAVLTASPLLPYQSPYFRLHFQIDKQGRFTSPQAPTQSQYALLNSPSLPPAQLARNNVELAKLSNSVEVAELEGCVAQVEQTMEQNFQTPVVATQTDNSAQAANAALTSADQMKDQPLQTRTANTQTDEVPAQKGITSQSSRNNAEWSKRQQAFAENVRDAGQTLEQNVLPASDENSASISVGPLVPIWLGGDATSDGELMFVRRVRAEGNEFYQGFLCDWVSLRSALLGEIVDLFPAANLVPDRHVAGQDEPARERAATSLATLPVSLRVPAPATKSAAGLTPGRITAALAWIVVLAGVGLTGSTLRSSIAFGKKRSQFASAVTHELRTPLTTFKMYTDMLAEGMISDEAQRQEYLRTLQSESDRLARLVENVLSYARLEDGRQTPNRRALTIGALLGRVMPPLERRADAAGMTIEMNCAAERSAAVHTDDDAVGQILLNLVDNACKYGRSEDSSTIHIDVAKNNGGLVFTVRDDGPGIAASETRHLFRAFHRGSTSESSQPGLGIGLTLSRALAQRLGGDLRFVHGHSHGASFTLTVPIGVSST